MKVVDNRATTIKRVCDIEFGKAFMTKNGRVYIRVSSELKVDLFDDEVLVMNSAGEVIGMSRDLLVDPINVELYIVD